MSPREAKEFLRQTFDKIDRMERQIRALSQQARRARKQSARHVADITGGAASARRAAHYEIKATKAESARFSLRLRLSQVRRGLVATLNRPQS